MELGYETKKIGISTITLDENLQVRESTREQTVKDYAELMRDGVVFPPVDVVQDASAGKIWLAHGWHRVLASKEANIDFIEANIYVGSWREAFKLACAGNVKNGLHWTRAEREKALRLWLNDEELGKMGNAMIAEQFGISASTVSRTRKALFGVEDAPKERIGKDGKTYTVPAPTFTTPKAFETPDDSAVVFTDIEDLYDHKSAPFESQPTATTTSFAAAPPKTYSAAQGYQNGNGSKPYAPPTLTSAAPTGKVHDLAITWVDHNGEMGEYDSSAPVPLPYEVRVYIKQLSGL